MIILPSQPQVAYIVIMRKTYTHTSSVSETYQYRVRRVPGHPSHSALVTF